MALPVASSSLIFASDIGPQQLGMVNTYWRCATGASTFASTHSP